MAGELQWRELEARIKETEALLKNLRGNLARIRRFCKHNNTKIEAGGGRCMDCGLCLNPDEVLI